MIRESMSADGRIIELPGDRLAEAAGFLAHSYHDHPNFIDLFPEKGARTRMLPHVFAACLRDALGFEHVYAAMRGDEIVGVATWLPPGTFPLSLRRQFRVLPDMVCVLATAPRSTRRLLRFMTNVSRRHPEQPYWYLENVGVEPAAQGLGVGTRLLEPVLALADAAGQPSYLEAQTERNVAWYRRLGFEVRDAEVSFALGGPLNWTMIRCPAQR